VTDLPGLFSKMPIEEKLEAEIASLGAELAEQIGFTDDYCRQMRRFSDKCESLRAAARQDAEEIEQLRKALEPFDAMARWYDTDYVDSDIALWQSRYSISIQLKVGDFRRARAALTPRPQEDKP